MKLQISRLSSVRCDGNTAVFSGDSGEIRLALFEPGIVRVSYEFYDLPALPGRNSIETMLTPGLTAAEGTAPVVPRGRWESVKEGETDFVLASGRVKAVVEKADGFVSVYEGDRLVHGGRVGTSDTVLPRFPLRAVSAAPGGEHGDGSVVRGKFIFPLGTEDAFFGLGDKAGPLDHRGRRFKMTNRDALGFDAGNSDPLYKSVPFFLRWNRTAGTLCGLYFPVPEVEEIDFGVESLFYYSVTAVRGPFEYFVFPGGDYASVLDRYTRLTGRPALPPLFSFGFLGSSMSYTEPDDAPARVLEYFDRIETEGVPCEGMYFSSGYVKASNGERYAFVWNRSKFPDPGAFISALRERGYRICFNLKPGILVTHPWYRDLAERNFLVPDADGKPYREYYWGNDASLFDFGKPEACAWWKEKVKEVFLRIGAAGIWNDNNEYEIEDEGVPARRLRHISPLLMMRASWEAFREERPGKRPWVMSRSGYAGMQRYARTWTGDNVSDYRSLAYNTFQGLSLGLSGIPYYGHDVGGFFGSFPDRELLLRFCQAAVFQPRFVIHSWKEGGVPVEPWSYPDIFPEIRKLIRLHYEFMPYIYNTAIEAHETGLPMERPLCLEFPEDLGQDPNDFAHLLGRSVYKVPAFSPGLERVEVRLPAGADWYDPERGVLLRGGRRTVIDTPLRGVRYLLRAGSVVPTAPGLASLATGLFGRVDFLLFPGDETVVYRYVEDDGESDFLPENRNEYEIRIGRADGKAATSYRLDFRVLAYHVSAVDRKRLFRFVLPPGFAFVLGEERPCAFEIEVGGYGPSDCTMFFDGAYKTGDEA